MEQKDFIPFQQALELKELGFDEPCGYLYNSSDDNPKPYPCDTLGLSQDWNTLYRKDTNNHLLSAPLYQQVFRWFREKYGVYFHQKKFDENKWWVEWGEWSSPVFETYEEAELECVKKLIEIAKL
jgi:hypothetical protein